MATPILGITELTPQAAGAEERVNEGFRILEAHGASWAKSQGDNAPPGTEVEGDVFIVGGSPTGDFAGHANELASKSSDGWLFYAAKQGARVYVQDVAHHFIFDGSAWAADVETKRIDVMSSPNQNGGGATTFWNGPTAGQRLGLNEFIFKAVNLPTDYDSGEDVVLKIPVHPFATEASKLISVEAQISVIGGLTSGSVGDTGSEFTVTVTDESVTTSNNEMQYLTFTLPAASLTAEVSEPVGISIRLTRIAATSSDLAADLGFPIAGGVALYQTLPR